MPQSHRAARPQELARSLSRRSREVLQALDSLKEVAGLTQGQIENVKDYSDQCHAGMETAFIDSISTPDARQNDASLIDSIISGIGVIKYARQKKRERLYRSH